MGGKLLTMAFGCWPPGISEGISRRCSAISGCAPRMGRGPPPCAMNMTGSSDMGLGQKRHSRKEGMERTNHRIPWSESMGAETNHDSAPTACERGFCLGLLVLLGEED